MNSPLWFSNLLFWIAQVALVTLAAAILIRLLRIRQPAVLLAHWRALLVISLLLPVLQPWHRQKLLAGIAAAATAPSSPVLPAAIPSTAHWEFPAWAAIAEILVVVVLVGIAVRFVSFVLGLVKLRQLRRASSAIPASAGCARSLEKIRSLVGASAEFRLSAHVDSPVTFGFAAPVILLPERFLQLTVESQLAVACHELLHVRRRDWVHHLAEETLRVVFWFHPAILWLVGRVRLTREQVVDLQVIGLTGARKTYLKALLEFTPGRSRLAAVPAPPFLGEHQLAERVSLMLKEVRMSRTRLVVSLSAVVCMLALAATLAVSILPLKASPSPQAPPQTAPGKTESLASKPVVNANAIWTGQVKRGDMPVQVPGFGTLVPVGYSAKLVAEVVVSGGIAQNVHLDQSALVDTGKGIVKGHVTHTGPADSNGNRWFDIRLDSPLPQGAGANTSVHAFIGTGKQLRNALYIPRPAGAFYGPGVFQMPMFKITDDGRYAVRVQVAYDPSDANAVQVLSGLQPGDTVILSDMLPYNRFARLQIAR
ncbi:MAG: M56 family metallopeptidase [Candidatus Acidiferrales bacterium]